MARGELLLQAVYGSIWAIMPEKLEAMLEVLDRWTAGQRLAADDVSARANGPSRAAPKPEGSAIAVLPLYGLIAHRAHMVENTSFGPESTSAERFGQLFDEALRDPDVGTIVLDVDSPGGNVAGVPELAAKIFAGRQQKRIIAVANALSASAAYWIATAASEVVCTPSGEVGSVGVFAIHTNTERRDAMQGIDRTVLKSTIGPHKAELNPYQKLDRSAADYVQAQLDEFGAMFIDALARHRAVSAPLVRERFGGGRTVSARQALAVGMIDRIATLEEVLADLGVSAKSRRPRDAGRDAGRAAAAAEAPVNAASALGATSALEDAPPLSASPAAASDRDALTILRPGASEDALVMSSPTLASAPPAQETPVTAPTTPAPAAGPGDEVAQLRARIARDEEIRNLCEFANAPIDQVNAFLASDKTPAQVRAELQAAKPRPTPVASHVRDRILDKKFGRVGEQLVAIMRAFTGHEVDPRLHEINGLALQAAGTGLNQGVASEGGFFIQEDLVDGVLDPIYRDDPILSRVTRVPMTRPSRKFNIVDESARTHGNRYGGIAMKWLGEGDQGTPVKPKTRRLELELKKLMGVGYFTDEDREDAPGSVDMMERAFNAETRFMMADGVFRGPGAGQPLGIKNSGAFTSVAIEGGQTIANSATHFATNSAKMMARIPAWLWSEAIWLYNPALFPTIVTATLGNAPIFIPTGGMPNRPSDTLWGRPAFASELCDAVGTPGDIVCVVPAEYYWGDRGVRKSTSIEVGWLKDESAMKIVLRADGMPLWKEAVTPFKGADKVTPYVGLAARA